MKKILVVASMLVSSAVFAAPVSSVAASTPTVPSVASSVHAASATPASQPRTLTVQQQKMVDCNKQATGKKGTDRKTFMSACLKKSPVAASTPMAK